MSSVTLMITMGDEHGAVEVPAFPIAPYMLLLSYFAQVLAPFAYLPNVLACFHVVKLASAYVAYFGNYTHSEIA
jgi:hypothetical protein